MGRITFAEGGRGGLEGMRRDFVSSLSLFLYWRGRFGRGLAGITIGGGDNGKLKSRDCHEVDLVPRVKTGN